MKRLVAVMVLLVCMAYAFAALAEEEPFYPGTYYVGRDFRAGNYNIHVEKISDRDPSVWISIYNNEEEFKQNDELLLRSFSTEGYHLSVVDGMVFTIELFHGGLLTIVNETLSWMMPSE